VAAVTVVLPQLLPRSGRQRWKCTTRDHRRVRVCRTWPVKVERIGSPWSHPACWAGGRRCSHTVAHTPGRTKPPRHAACLASQVEVPHGADAAALACWRASTAVQAGAGTASAPRRAARPRPQPAPATAPTVGPVPAARGPPRSCRAWRRPSWRAGLRARRAPARPHPGPPSCAPAPAHLPTHRPAERSAPANRSRAEQGAAAAAVEHHTACRVQAQSRPAEPRARARGGADHAGRQSAEGAHQWAQRAGTAATTPARSASPGPPPHRARSLASPQLSLRAQAESSATKQLSGRSRQERGSAMTGERPSDKPPVTGSKPAADSTAADTAGTSPPTCSRTARLLTPRRAP